MHFIIRLTNQDVATNAVQIAKLLHNNGWI